MKMYSTIYWPIPCKPNKKEFLHESCLNWQEILATKYLSISFTVASDTWQPVGYNIPIMKFSPIKETKEAKNFTEN